jgi:hypothetical protein
MKKTVQTTDLQGLDLEERLQVLGATVALLHHHGFPIRNLRLDSEQLVP